MSDPVERIRKFVEQQQMNLRYEEGKSVWSKRVSQLVAHVESVAAALRDGLEPDEAETTQIAVLANPERELYPLMVAFNHRTCVYNDQSPNEREIESGATALFRCEGNGRVYGFRFPFHRLGDAVPPPERFVDLGFPGDIKIDDLGNAVADFLEWAATGDGAGRRKLRFGTPATLPFVPRETMSLRVFAA